MRSSLKKSLYLGLAALSFASVAGTSLASTSASAKTKKTAKKHVKKHAKKVKKAKKAKKITHISHVANIGNQSASTSAYTLKSGVLTNKPAGVKGSKNIASGLSSNELFMAYQKVTLNNKKVFYKVVSFTNHQHRGFVSADDVQTTQTFTPGTNNLNTNAVYLSHPGEQSLYKDPQGSTFKDQIAVSSALTSRLATDQFGINQVATVSSTGKTSYHLVDLRDNSIQGWVNSDQVVSAATTNRYFDANKDIKVNFVSNGNTVASQLVNVVDLNTSDSTKYQNPTSNDRVLSNDFVKSLFNGSDNNFTIRDASAGNSANLDNLSTPLANLGYQVSSADLNYSLQSLNGLKVGDSLNINISKLAASDTQTSKLAFKSITPGTDGLYNPADAKTISDSEINFPSLTDAQKTAYQNAFTGNKNVFVGYNSANNSFTNPFTSDLFKDYNNANNGAFAAFDGAKSNQSITNASQYTNGKNGVLAFTSFKDAQDAYAAGHNSVNDAANSGRVTILPIGRQYHYAYFFDFAATTAYNAKATLYGQTLTAIYDKVPVATSVATNNTTNNGFTGYQA